MGRSSPGEHLRTLQTQYPPWRGVDRGLTLYSGLASHLPAELVRLHDTGQLLAGEIGLAKPAAMTRRLAEHEYAVEITSGLLEFLYSVIRILGGLNRVWGNSGVITEPKLSLAEATHHYKDLVERFKSGALNERKFTHATFPLHPEQIAVAEDLTTQAERYILGHELGHVVQWELGSPRADQRGQEVVADVLALGLVLRASDPRRVRMTYAGALIALRVFASLERLDVSFGGPHPRPVERVEILKTAAKQTFTDRRSFRYYRTIAFAWDELMEAVENSLLGRGPDTMQTADRVVSRLEVILEECAKARMTLEVALGEASKSLAVVMSRDVLESAGNEICSTYISENPERPHDEKMSQILEWMIPQFPDPSRSIFEAARDSAPCTVAAAKRRLAAYRQLAIGEPDKFGDMAISFARRLAQGLRSGGSIEDIVEVEEEEVAICRELARLLPKRFQIHLAFSLNNLSISLREVGRTADALRAAKEAVAAYRSAMGPDDVGLRPGLAVCLNNLGNCLSEVGEEQAAMTAKAEIVSVFRELAASNHAQYDQHLVTALHNLAVCLSRLQRFDEAFDAEEEAIAILSPYFFADPNTADEMQQRIRDYRTLARECGRAVRSDLVDPIVLGLSAREAPGGSDGRN